jgi:hypothetical protein
MDVSMATPPSGTEQPPTKHRPAEQQPSLQTLLAQQGSPRAPQRAHAPLLQVKAS